MKLVKTIVRFDDGGSAFCDTAVTATRKLLVPEWIDTPALQATRPARTIELDDQLLQALELDQDQARFRLLLPIPKAVFDGREFPKEGPFAKVELEPAWPPIDDE